MGAYYLTKASSGQLPAAFFCVSLRSLSHKINQRLSAADSGVMQNKSMRFTFSLKDDWLIYAISAGFMYGAFRDESVLYAIVSLIAFLTFMPKLWLARWCSSCKSKTVRLPEEEESDYALRYKCPLCGKIFNTKITGG